MSQTIYQESTSHLEEVLHKSNNMLKEMVRKNLTYLHLYNGFLESTSDEAEIQALPTMPLPSLIIMMRC